MQGLAQPFFLLSLLMPFIAAAQHEPLTLADDPFEITDPLAASPGEAELSIVGIYERARRGRHRGTVALQSEFEAGVATGLAFRIGQEGAYGNLQTRRRLDAAAPMEGSEGRAPAWGGATRIGALYQIAEDRGTMPAIGLLGRVRAVYGPGRPTQEADVVALFGKTLGSGERPLGINMNLGWTRPFDPLPGERTGRYFVNASVGQAFTRDSVLVLTYVREQQERGERDFQLVQAGIRHRLGADGPVLGLAVGAGLGRDSPAFQLGLAVQWSFGLAER
jgi:hypothetical protein